MPRLRHPGGRAAYPPPRGIPARNFGDASSLSHANRDRPWMAGSQYPNHDEVSSGR